MQSDIDTNPYTIDPLPLTGSLSSEEYYFRIFRLMLDSFTLEQSDIMAVSDF